MVFTWRSEYNPPNKHMETSDDRDPPRKKRQDALYVHVIETLARQHRTKHKNRNTKAEKEKERINYKWHFLNWQLKQSRFPVPFWYGSSSWRIQSKPNWEYYAKLCVLWGALRRRLWQKGFFSIQFPHIPLWKNNLANIIQNAQCQTQTILRTKKNIPSWDISTMYDFSPFVVSFRTSVNCVKPTNAFLLYIVLQTRLTIKRLFTLFLHLYLQMHW